MLSILLCLSVLMPENSAEPTTLESPARSRRIWWTAAASAIVVAGIVGADYSRTIPETARPTYVGRNRCAECHQSQHTQWQGSHHDLAMDLATDETVLGDFDDASLEHYGITTRMFRDGEKFMMNTEGPDGQMADFEVKYVFGVTPLQQYMVELGRPADLPDDEIGRVQVLRVSWDTKQQRWFYLSPPDVDEKLAPDDDLHWTGIAQRWNNMCADCHSTNVRRGHDPQSGTYHTTFSEMDVSCEACHGPGSLHVQLAERTSLFWDRKRGYGLARLKDVNNTDIQITACAPCHSRRRVIKEGYHAGDDFYDHYALETLSPQTYHCDGQVLDEVYVVGSFLQSKMYHKGIRCTDCHDPHTARLKHQGNQVCTSCHQHSAGRYDNPSHHFHKVGSEGAKCVNCHMPSTTFMDVDARRDHSLRVPRPDLSVELGAPNACTGCHLDRAKLPEETTQGFEQYKDWMLAARPVDGSSPQQEVKTALEEIDRWAAEQCDQWYGADRKSKTPHFGEGLHAAWNDPSAVPDAIQRWLRPQTPAIIRGSLLETLLTAPINEPSDKMLEALSDPSPTVRAAAAASFENLIPSGPELAEATDEQIIQMSDSLAPVIRPLWPLLNDPVRSVRTEAARVLSRVPPAALAYVSDNTQRQALKAGMDELKEALAIISDRGGSHAILGSLHENLGQLRKAIDAYETAVRVEPGLAGPRTNLAALYDREAGKLQREGQQIIQQRTQMQLAIRQGSPPNETKMKRMEQNYVQAMTEADRLQRRAAELRVEEQPLLERDAKLAPHNSAIQHRLGMCAYLNGDLDLAEASLRRAVELDGDSPRYTLMLALLLEKREKFGEALRWADRLLELAPDNPGYRQLRENIAARVTAGPPVE